LCSDVCILVYVYTCVARSAWIFDCWLDSRPVGQAITNYRSCVVED